MYLKQAIKLAFLGLATTIITTTAMASQTNKAILHTYADLATSSYNQALSNAQGLQATLQAFANAPTKNTMEAAKQAWLQSRETYGVTEIFRLSAGPIDAEDGWVADAYGALEGQINAWPLDENMIDYTTAADGTITTGNIIDTKGVFNPGGKPVDVTTITADSLAALNENGGDANVSSGYHAIEFLLWGQDQDYDSFAADTVTNGALSAGERPLTDFTEDDLAGRRFAYLNAAAELLVTDLQTVASAWDKGDRYSSCATDMTGCYRSAFLGELTAADADKNITSTDALRTVIAGMGVFIKSELANERIAVPVLTPSEEDEHSCFSDNTHRDIALNYQGFVNVLKGELAGQDMGVSMYDNASADTRSQLDGLISAIDTRVDTMNELAATSMHFDYQIVDAKQADEIRRMKNDMRKLGDTMTAIAADLGISLSVADVTDAEETQL
jgi:putative iron-regulated protein